MRVCSVLGCGEVFYSRGWCRAHYYRWWSTGGVRPEDPIGHRKMGTDLPNPWINVSPPCPLCSSSAWVFLWAAEGDLRWFCQTCRKRFDVVMEAVA